MGNSYTFNIKERKAPNKFINYLLELDESYYDRDNLLMSCLRFSLVANSMFWCILYSILYYTFLIKYLDLIEYFATLGFVFILVIWCVTTIFLGNFISSYIHKKLKSICPFEDFTITYEVEENGLKIKDSRNKWVEIVKWSEITSFDFMRLSGKAWYDKNGDEISCLVLNKGDIKKSIKGKFVDINTIEIKKEINIPKECKELIDEIVKTSGIKVSIFIQ